MSRKPSSKDAEKMGKMVFRISIFLLIISLLGMIFGPGLANTAFLESPSVIGFIAITPLFTGGAAIAVMLFIFLPLSRYDIELRDAEMQIDFYQKYTEEIREAGKEGDDELRKLALEGINWNGVPTPVSGIDIAEFRKNMEEQIRANDKILGEIKVPDKPRFYDFLAQYLVPKDEE